MNDFFNEDNLKMLAKLEEQKKDLNINLKQETDHSNPKYYELQKEFITWNTEFRLKLFQKVMKQYLILFGFVFLFLLGICLIYTKLS